MCTLILRALQFLQNQNKLYYSTALTDYPSLVAIFLLFSKLPLINLADFLCAEFGRKK